MANRIRRSIGSIALLGAVSIGGMYASRAWQERDDVERNDIGEVVDDGDLDAFSIRVGDCFLEPGAAEIASVSAGPCGQPHDYQAYHVFDLPPTAFPGDVEIDQQAETGCLAQVPVDISDGVLHVGWLKPTLESWTQGGDREIVCTISRTDGAPIAGSLVPGF